MSGGISLTQIVNTSVKTAVDIATTGALPANVYNNGSGGIGATLTASINGALPVQDGIAPFLNARFLVKNEVVAANNGIYIITNLGSSNSKYVLIRANDFNSVNNILPGSNMLVTQGTINGMFEFFMGTLEPIVVGTTNLTFTSTFNNSVPLLGDNNGPSNNNVATLTRNYRKLTLIGGW